MSKCTGSQTRNSSNHSSTLHIPCNGLWLCHNVHGIKPGTPPTIHQHYIFLVMVYGYVKNVQGVKPGTAPTIHQHYILLVMVYGYVKMYRESNQEHLQPYININAACQTLELECLAPCQSLLIWLSTFGSIKLGQNKDRSAVQN